MTTIESVTVTFEVACSGALAKFCRTRDFSAWPFSYDKTAFQFNVFFYKDRASDTKREAPSDGDLRYMFIVSSDRPVQTIPMSSSVYIEIESPGSAFIHHSLGNLRAKQDFLNARVAVNQIVSREDLIRTLPISVVWVRLRFRDGEDVYVSDFQKFFNLKGDSQDWGFESLWAAVVERAQGSANSSTRRRILRL